MIAVDTSVWVDFFRGRPTPPVRFLMRCLAEQPDRIVLIDLVFTEIMRGLRDEQVERVEARLLKFDVLRLRHMADFRAAAGLYRAARRKGIVIRSTIDCLIAAMCMRENIPLLHSDKDFTRLAQIATLSVVDVE